MQLSEMFGYNCGLIIQIYYVSTQITVYSRLLTSDLKSSPRKKSIADWGLMTMITSSQGTKIQFSSTRRRIYKEMNESVFLVHYYSQAMQLKKKKKKKTVTSAALQLSHTLTPSTKTHITPEINKYRHFFHTANLRPHNETAGRWACLVNAMRSNKMSQQFNSAAPRQAKSVGRGWPV